MRRKPNKNNGGGGNNQMARRRFRPEQNAGKIKSAAANRDKYLNLAREAMSQGDRIEAENFLQHADHYFRVLSTLQEEDARNRPERPEFTGQKPDLEVVGEGEEALTSDAQEESAEGEEEPAPLLAAAS